MSFCPAYARQAIGLWLQLFLLLVAGHPGVSDGEQDRLIIRQYHIPKPAHPLHLQVCWEPTLVEHSPAD